MDHSLDEFFDKASLSIAHLREFVRSAMIFKKDPKETLERIKKMRIVPQSMKRGNIGISKEDG